MPFPTFKKKDEIPKGFEAEYEERDGEWHAKVPDVAKLETTLGTVRTEKRDAEKRAKDAEDKAGDLQRQLDAAKVTGVDVDKKVAEALDKWNKDKDTAVKAVQDQLDAANGELRTLKLDDQLKAVFLKAGGRAEKAAAALELNKKRFDLVDGKIVMKNDKGEVEPGTAEDYFTKNFKTEMPEFYTGTKAAGGGALGGLHNTPTPTDATAADALIKNPLQALKDANEAAAAGK